MAINVTAARIEALFCSDRQPSEQPGPEQVAESIAAAARKFGTRWCALQVAQEYGEHPESAAARMLWAGELVTDTFQRPDGKGRTYRLSGHGGAR